MPFFKSIINYFVFLSLLLLFFATFAVKKGKMIVFLYNSVLFVKQKQQRQALH